MNTNDISRDFVAVDVEYADSEQNICQLGLVVVRDLKVVERRKWLIQPPGNFYEKRFMDVHGITPGDTAFAPTFDQAWPEIAGYLKEDQLWAHNAVSVEDPVINKNLRLAYIDDNVHVLDSRDLYSRPDCPPDKGNGLVQCCMALGLQTGSHHDALADAEMCAMIVIAAAEGRQPVWDGVPLTSEQLRKAGQGKIMLKMGGFAAHQQLQDEEKKAGLVGDKVDLLAELTSSYDGAKPQVVDVFDKGDQMQKEGQDIVDIARLDMSEGNPLRDKVVAMTGFFHISRKEIERALAAMGATTDGMTKNTDVLLVGNRNVGLPKLAKYEKQTAKGRSVALVVGDTDLDALLYGDGRKFFVNA